MSDWEFVRLLETNYCCSFQLPAGTVQKRQRKIYLILNIDDLKGVIKIGNVP